MDAALPRKRVNAMHYSFLVASAPGPKSLVHLSLLPSKAFYTILSAIILQILYYDWCQRKGTFSMLNWFPFYRTILKLFAI